MRHSQSLPDARAGAAVAVAERPALPSNVLLALAIGLAALGVLFLPEARAAVGTWNSSTAYGHCYLVLPMTLYLIWERRSVLTAVSARGEPVLAVLAAPVALGWLVAERLGIMEAQQLMVLAAVQVLLLVVLGRDLFRALLGPLLFLFFLVPFGAFLTPVLQQFTARFTAIGLNLLGIPNYTDDLVIEIPAGTFFVAEACAGLRFLIAAVAFGVFYAVLNYRSPARRLLFIGASIVVPIVANGVRALGIVVLGHVLGSAEAAAADHIIYGWVFFSVVMLLLVVAGLPLREPIGAPATRLAPAPSKRSNAPMWGAIAVAVLLAMGPAAAQLLNAQARPAPLAEVPALALPPGCERLGAPPVLPATRIDLQVSCAGQAMQVVIQTFPARSTPASLVAERHRATGELTAEDTRFTPLTLDAAGAGTWTLAQTSQPFRTTALAAWADGAPAPSGLMGRVLLARDSVLGSDHAKALVSVTALQSERLSVERERLLVDTIRSFVAAQTELTTALEVATRVR